MANDLVDRRYISRYAQPGFGLKVYRAGALVDADAVPTVSLLAEGETVPLWTRDAERVEQGSYGITLASTDTAQQMQGTLLWNYVLDAIPQIYGTDLEVGPSAPAYDALSPVWQDIIESVWVKFADLFDSPYGGPNLQVYVQTHFGRNRLAQLLNSALQRLNTASSPHASHDLGGISFPFKEWGGLLEDALYLEVVKHLIRSYVEQPEVITGTTFTRTDRRDYMQRWREMYDLETGVFEADLKKYRMANLGLGHFSVLVAGGAYGNYGPSINPGGVGAAAARGYYWTSRMH
jgi:hypothetical protein